MPHLDLKPKKDLSSFRRIAIGTWATAYDPQVYGTMHLRVDRALEYIEEFRARTGKRLTLTHMMAQAMGATLALMPDGNAILRWNRIYLRRRIGVFFQVAMQDPQSGELDLSGATVFEPHAKSLAQIVDEFDAQVALVRAAKDPALEKTRSTFKKIPYFLLNRFIKLLSFLLYSLNLDLRRFGLPRDPFGSIMITNIGALGLELAHAPLVPYSRVPVVITMGAVHEAPVVEAGQVVVGRVMSLGAVFDHRVLDGSHAAIVGTQLKAWFEDPARHFGGLEPPAPPAAAGPAAAPPLAPTA